jgi:hypothetical protein
MDGGNSKDQFKYGIFKKFLKYFKLMVFSEQCTKLHPLWLVGNTGQAKFV